MSTNHNAHNHPGAAGDPAPPPADVVERSQKPRYDGVPSFVPTDPRSLTPLGRTLPADPLTGMYGSNTPSWVVPLGVSLVTAFVVFAAGGLVVRGWRSAESTPVVTTAEVAPAARAPDTGVPLSEVVKARPAPAATSEAAASGDEDDAKQTGAADSTDKDDDATTQRTPTTRTTSRRTAGSQGKARADGSATPQSAADYLPGTL